MKVRIKKLQTELKSRFKEIQDLKDDGKKILWDRYNGEDCISAIEELDALASDISDLYRLDKPFVGRVYNSDTIITSTEKIIDSFETLTKFIDKYIENSNEKLKVYGRKYAYADYDDLKYSCKKNIEKLKEILVLDDTIQKMQNETRLEIYIILTMQ